MEQTTLESVADWVPAEEDIQAYRRFINVLDENYPPGWRGWIVNKLSYEDLFGENISSDDENRLRFAVPTVDLARALSNDGIASLSERRYKSIKRKLLSWPIGRAIIYSPLATTKKIHPENIYNGFLILVQKLKPKLISRHEASAILRAGSSCENTSSRSSASTSAPNRKRSHSPENSILSPKEPRLTETLTDFMRQQNQLLNRIAQMTEANFHATNSFRPHSRSEEAEVEVHNDDSDWRPEYTQNNADWETPTEERTPTSSHNFEEDLEKEHFNSFEPATIESEAKIGAANPVLVNQGTFCQRLGTDGWQNIRYAEVQKQFQATPVFTSLKTNNLLATVTPSWQSVTLLEKMDLCLGAITNGLIQQRQHFTQLFNKASPEVKRHINQNFLAKDSDFRKTSDALLQYTCGKRAEVLQQRRSVYKPNNKTLNELLQAIPPSTTHLFSEPQLSELIKEQGGLMKFFPGRFRNSTSKPTGPRREIPPTLPQENRRKDVQRKPIFRQYPERNTNRPSTSGTKRQFQHAAGKQKRTRFDGRK